MIIHHEIEVHEPDWPLLIAVLTNSGGLRQSDIARALDVPRSWVLRVMNGDQNGVLWRHGTRLMILARNRLTEEQINKCIPEKAHA